MKIKLLVFVIIIIFALNIIIFYNPFKVEIFGLNFEVTKQSYTVSPNEIINNANFYPQSKYTNFNNLNLAKIVKLRNNFTKSALRFGDKNMEIFIYGKYDYISNHIIRDGIWEGNWIIQIISYIKQNPRIQFIDVGCNVGVYTLIVASMGCNVVAIDANKNNTDRLIQSVINNNLENKVKIVLNAVSNERKNYSMNRVLNNIGGQKIKEYKNDQYQVKGILLNDLLPILEENIDVIIKIDIEHNENKAFEGATVLFNSRNIKLIIMEWSGLRNMGNTENIISFFIGRKYKPFASVFSDTVLEITQYRSWPDDIVWRSDTSLYH